MGWERALLRGGTTKWWSEEDNRRVVSVAVVGKAMGGNDRSKWGDVQGEEGGSKDGALWDTRGQLAGS